MAFPGGVGAPEPSPPPVRLLAGGVVAHNEERNIEAAIRSLLDQDLPSGVRWSSFVVVASGCSDGTLAIAERVAREDPRVRVIAESERRGKSHALRTVLSEADGDAVVLLNSDAIAQAGAVRNLLRASEGRAAPFAVMGRPVVPTDGSGPWSGAVSAMWKLHHHFHETLQAHGGGAHLSDELLLVSLDPMPPMPDGVINDGSYLGVWLAQHLGGRWYAPDARVTIQVPGSMKDHLVQRRRIHVGNAQVTSLLGLAPSTFFRLLVQEPSEAIHLVRCVVGSQPGGAQGFLALAVAELASQVLAVWDRIPPARDHVHWQRIRPPSPSVAAGTPRPNLARPSVEARVRSILSVAARFRTGVSVHELAALLPDGSPTTGDRVTDWLRGRPDLARIENGRAFAPDEPGNSLAEREERGRRYEEVATELFARELRPLVPWLRSYGLTGSAAYGQPDKQDDLDLLVVTRAGALWWFLALCYARIRLGDLRPRKGEIPMPCFNYVLDDRQAPREFETARGFLFAREALTARILHGDPYYTSLLERAPWMAEEIPRLYSARRGTMTPEDPPNPVPLAVRLANTLVFPVLATYLQLVGIRRNARFRARASGEEAFRTETGFRRVTFSSKRFEGLRVAYGTPFATEAGRASMSPPSRIPSSR